MNLTEQTTVLQEPFLSIDQARKLFNPVVSRPTICRWADRGVIPVIKLDGKRYFLASQIREALVKKGA